MKKFISFSGGVESTTMCLLYGKGATAIVCDTGDEEPEMYARWDFVEESLKVLHDGDFELIRIKPRINVKGKDCTSLDELAAAYGFFPGSGSRYCTRQLKIEPIDNFLTSQGLCELMIGLNADEEDGRTGSFMKCPNVSYTYPLADDGLTREDCIAELEKYSLQPDFPPYMQRGGCRKCFFRSKKETKAKYFFNRAGFLEDMDFEEKLQDRRKKFYGINMNFKGGYRTVAAECEQEIELFGEEAIRETYKVVQAHRACGVFCHR